MGLSDCANVTVMHRKDSDHRYRIVLPTKLLSHGARLLEGKYTASYFDSRGNQLEFAPVFVTKDSPELLEFHPRGAQSYTGRVINGLNGDPVEGAIVFGAYGSGQKRLVDISDDQFDALAKVSIGEIDDHPTTKALAEVKDIVGITRTDEKGQYTISVDPTKKIYGLYLVGAGIVPDEVRAKPAQEQNAAGGLEIADGAIVVDTLHQFPSGRLSFSFKQEGLNVWPDWDVAKEWEDRPDWSERFVHRLEARHGLPGFYPTKYWVRGEGKHRLILPADVPIQMKFSPGQRDAYGPVVISDAIRLSPGEELDLAEVEMPPTSPVPVRIVGPNGNPVEGVGVWFRYEHDGWHSAGTSSPEGFVTTKVAPGRGEFGVLRLGNPNEYLRAENLKTPFELKADAPLDPYTIQLTADQVKRVPVEGPER